LNPSTAPAWRALLRVTWAMGLRVRAAWRITVTNPNLADIRRTFEDKIKAGMFRHVERHLHEDIREERMQEALGLTWRLYADRAQRGEILDDALLVHACKLKAIDLSRHVVECDYQPLRDVLDLRNYLAGRVEVLRLGDPHEEEDEGEGHRFEKGDKLVSIGFAELRCINPARNIHSAIDLTAWLAELPAEDRHMLELRASGYTLEETADKLGVSLSYVFATCRRLGVALAEHAGIPVEPRRHRDSNAEVKPASTRRLRVSMADALPRKRGGLKKASRARRPEAVPCAA
jgi:hypothetical protein